MKTLDILALPKTESSLSIIKSYLQTNLTRSEYEQVFLRMLEIEQFLGLDKNVIQEGEDFLNNFASDESKYYSDLLKILFDSSLNLKDFDRSEYYLDEHRKYVPILEEYIVDSDAIKLAKMAGRPYLDKLVKITQSATPNEIKIPFYVELLELYINDSKFALAKEVLDDLKLISSDKYYKQELEILYGLGLYDELIIKAESYKDINEAVIPSVLMLMRVYFEQNKDHRMTVIDSEYEHHFENATIDQRKEFYEICIKLYQKLGSKQSEEHYTKLLRDIKRLETRQQRDQAKQEKELAQKIETTIVTPLQKTKELSRKDEKRQISNFFDIFMFAEGISEKFVLRDYLRTLFIFIDNYIRPSDYVIYLNDGRLFHYKKERLYEKRILEELTYHTIIRDIVNKETEFFSNPLDLEKNIEVVSQLPYDVNTKYVYGIPLEGQGAFLVYFEENIVDPETYYDFVKLISGLIFSKLNQENKLKVFRKENLFLTNILKSDLIALRTLTEIKTTYNPLAQKMFMQDENQYIDSFYMKLKPDFIRVYREQIKKMFQKPNQKALINYRYDNKFIEERMVSILDGDQIKIVSAFIDTTDSVIKLESSLEKAIRDPETNLYNLAHLKDQMSDLMESKVTFIAVELNMDNRHIYGPDNSFLYFREFVKITDNFFPDGITYRTDFNELIITIPVNDVRTVNNTLKSYIKFIDEYQVISIPYEQYQIKMGVLRYPVATTHTNVDTILKYIDIAKEKAKLRKDLIYHQFSYNDYEDEVFEQSVINHLNDALDRKDLHLSFNQIINVEKTLVWQYESQLSLENLNIEPKYITTLAKKRNRIIELERFHILKVLDFLVKLSNETKYLIKITIPVSEETFLDQTFNPFLIGAVKDRKLSFNFIRLKVDLANIKTHHYTHKIHELLNTGISLDTTSLAMVLTYPFNALYVDFNDGDIKWQTYYKELAKVLEGFHIALIASNVNSKEAYETVKRLNIKYASGQIYPKVDAEKLLQQIIEMMNDDK